MALAFVAVIFGVALLVWSADRFVDGAAVTARHFGMPSLLIGMVIVGFGTSAPEMVVSALSSWQGNPGIALGNAYGSNIVNIALILGLTALISPIVVHSNVVKKELPILCAITGLAIWQLLDGALTRLDAFGLLGVFAAVMGWSIWSGLRNRDDALGIETEAELTEHPMSLGKAVFWLVVGLLLLIASSRILVWGAVAIAQGFGISDLLIGLTIVAVGTSLPELASSLLAARKGEHDIAIGNVIGSNLFNTLAVVGISGLIQPGLLPAGMLSRDILVMGLLTIALFPLVFASGRTPRIGRVAGGLLLTSYVGYTAYLVVSTTAAVAGT
jgi:cation:H+ antiporter